MFRKLIWIAALLVTTGWACAPPAQACNIPVFRYALERWKSDATEVIVFHEGPLSARQKEALQSVREAADQGMANVNAVLVDLQAKPEAKYSELWEQLQKAGDVAAPHVVIRTTVGNGRLLNHWHGSIDEFQKLSLLGSPVRKELGRRLLAGHSVVWLMVRSEDDAKNAKAKQQVKGMFETLSRNVQLPEGIGLPGSELYADVPLFLKFSVLEIDPQDARESFLSGLFTGIRKDAFSDGDPLLVPVFGRGRALEVIPASDLSQSLIQQLTVFLSGACSCQVKEQNPGFDLLMSIDWDGELFGGEENRPPDRSAEEGRNRDPVLVPIPPGRKK